MSQAKAGAVRWPRIIATLLLALLFLEAAGRIVIYVWAGQPYRSLSPYVWSPYGLVRNNPRLTSPGFVINKNGFRDLRDYTQAKPPKTLRVILLGGSTLYAGLQANVFNVVPETLRVDSASTIAQFLRARLVADPALADFNIEVINAAVNFNRIVEVSGSYLAEYAHWQPDFVIVAGSANNFSVAMPKDAVAHRNWEIMTDHPWRREFERIVNRNDLLSAFENVVRALGDHSAAVALSVKLSSKAVDSAFARTAGLATRLGFVRDSSAPVELAEWSEFDRYIDEYLGYAAAMVALAHYRGQEIAFFWEHLLAHIGSVKPLTPLESRLFEANRGAAAEHNAAFTYYAQRKIAEFCRRNGVPFLDPIERLKTHSGPVFIDYVHYTADGNRFMADFIYDQLRDAIHRKAAQLRSQPPRI